MNWLGSFDRFVAICDDMAAESVNLANQVQCTLKISAVH